MALSLDILRGRQADQPTPRVPYRTREDLQQQTEVSNSPQGISLLRRLQDQVASWAVFNRRPANSQAATLAEQGDTKLVLYRGNGNDQPSIGYVRAPDGSLWEIRRGDRVIEEGDKRRVVDILQLEEPLLGCSYQKTAEIPELNTKNESEEKQLVVRAPDGAIIVTEGQLTVLTNDNNVISLHEEPPGTQIEGYKVLQS